ncbi:hypothetical protein KAR91_32600 [Candidatus Pacearchaeota archaeon]|nr:hypothetical protein [Candidatus Pacearchaeota archaeon]
MIVSFDVETTGLRPYHGDRVFSYCIGYSPGNVKIYRRDEWQNQFWQPLRKILHNPNIEITSWNLKFELSLLSVHNIDWPSNKIWHDGMQMMRLFRNNDDGYALEHVSWKYGNYDNSFTYKENGKNITVPNLDKFIKQMGKDLGGYQNIEKRFMNPYQRRDGERPLLIHEAMFPLLLEDKKLYEYYLHQIELIKVTQRMEERGVFVKKKEVDKLSIHLAKEIFEIKSDIFNLAGERFNINSFQQLGVILYDKLGLPVLTKTETGANSTDKDTLFALYEQTGNEIVDHVNKYRSYSKSLAMIQSYKKLTDEDGILHADLQSNAASTGRFKCKLPNLQNISAGQNEKIKYPVNARGCFGPRPGYMWYLCDYAGVDLRTIIELTKDKELLNILASGGDVHIPGVECTYGDRFKKAIKNSDEWKSMRKSGKNINFALPYGAGEDLVAKTAKISTEEAKIACQRWKERLPGVYNFATHEQKNVMEKGYVDTVFGRKFYIPEQEAYTGSAIKVQAVTAYINMMSGLILSKYIKKNWKDQMHLVLTIHDEWIIEVPLELVKWEKMYLVAMSLLLVDIPYISVKLEIEWKRTLTTWKVAKEVKI